eukprot:TRINITY_DN65_c2_g1_i12.p1 TRINITY_DN65_c2_g1~~TRINITY_DN65_c2_g1_i12.p1  ORF type:complete len:249 (+),score=97.05 TRINITY_DN65_c2_g1_i12:67-813(+)
MPVLKVISFKICPFVQRITALLEAKKTPYVVEYINLKEKPQWFLDISPNGQVPLLVTEKEEVLFESEAIAEYIEEAYPALQPDLSLVQRAQNRAWGYLGSKNYMPQCGAQSSSDGETLRERTMKIATAFAKVEKVLGGAEFFNSDTVSTVDMTWLPLLHRTQIIKEKTGYDFAHGYPKVQNWRAALMKTGLCEKSISEDFMTPFANFYLSESTVLGRMHAKGLSCESNASNLEEVCKQQGCSDILLKQ